MYACAFFLFISVAVRGFRIVAISKTPLQIVGPYKRERGEKLAADEIDFVDEVRVVDFAANPAQVEGILTGCHAVIHLAALPKPWESFENVMRTNSTSGVVCVCVCVCVRACMKEEGSTCPPLVHVL